VSIALERPDTPDAIALINELEAYLTPLSPAESRHGYPVEKLLKKGVAFFVVRIQGEAAGCGGVQIYSEDEVEPYAELKRIYVRPAFRGLGLARRLIACLEAHAQGQGIALMRLETGPAQVEANALYVRLGYRLTGPFGEYHLDPHSRYYEKRR
jgi:ribosomal protein S18 acetylase RimI-like enzyme